MPRYYFHTEDGESRRDHDGTELPDHAAAKDRAVELLITLLREHGGDLWKDKVLRLIVTDDTGLILFALDLSGVVAPAIGKALIK